MADKRGQDRKQEVDSKFVYHETRLPSITGRFNADVWLSSVDDAVVENREALGNEEPDAILLLELSC